MKKKHITLDLALLKAQTLCAHQEKCIADVRKKLFDWKLPQQYHQQLIEKLRNEKFIDEERYARSFVNDKFKYNKWGKVKIEFALRQKNIPENFINDALSEISETEYEILLRNELTKKVKSIKDQEEYTIKSKLVRFAASRGFENGKVFDMISSILEINKNEKD